MYAAISMMEMHVADAIVNSLLALPRFGNPSQLFVAQSMPRLVRWQHNAKNLRLEAEALLAD